MVFYQFLTTESQSELRKARTPRFFREIRIVQIEKLKILNIWIDCWPRSSFQTTQHIF